MRIGIISDIHANMPALEMVMEDLGNQHVDATYCLGDLVGYAPFPNEVTARIQSDGIPTVMGNYDDGLDSIGMKCGCVYRDPEDQRLGDPSLMWKGRRCGRSSRRFCDPCGQRFASRPTGSGSGSSTAAQGA